MSADLHKLKGDSDKILQLQPFRKSDPESTTTTSSSIAYCIIRMNLLRGVTSLLLNDQILPPSDNGVGRLLIDLFQWSLTQ